MKHQLRLAWTLVSAHLRKYLRIGVFVGSASVLVTLELLLVERLLNARATIQRSASQVEAWRVNNAVLQNQLLLVVVAVVTVGIAIYLSRRGLSDVIESRRSELAVFRSLGAPRRYIFRLIRWELALVSALFSTVGAAIGQILHFFMWSWYEAVGLLGSVAGLRPGFSPLVILSVVVTFVASSAVAATLHSRSVVDPLLPEEWHDEAVKRSTRGRLLFALLCFIGVLAAFILAPVTGQHAGAWVLISPLVAIVPFAIAAPAVLVVMGKAISKALSSLCAGPIFLARAIIIRDRRSIARKLVPVLIVVGLYGGFALGVQPEQARAAAEYQNVISANLVISKISPVQADRTVEMVSSECAAARHARSSAFQDITRTGAVPPIILDFIDTSVLGSVLLFKDPAGKVGLLGDQEAISTRAGDKIGDVISLTTLDGKQRTLTVVGTANFGEQESLYVDWNSFVGDERELKNVEVLLYCRFPETVVARIAAQEADILVQTKKEYVDELSLIRLKNSERSNLMLFGTIYAITVVGMLQGAYSYGRQRAGDFRVIRSLGISGAACKLSVLFEFVIILFTALLLAASSLALVVFRLWLGFRAHGLASYVSLPVMDVFRVFVAMAALLALGYITGAWLAISRSTRLGRPDII